MHSRIFQISENPVKKEEYINVDKILDSESFVGTIADYVAESDREEDIEWLVSCIKDYGIEYDNQQDMIIFKKGFKENYFQGRFEKLKEKINSMTLEEFAKGDFSLYEIRMLIEEKFGFYVYYKGDYCDDIMPFDSFVRMMEEERKYYIGGTLDYHC